MKPHPTMLAGAAALPLSLSLLFASALAHPSRLIVVEDRGGVSALPYYAPLNLQPPGPHTDPPIEVSRPTIGNVAESDMLPIRSQRLSPGEVRHRVIQAPGLTPIFLVGDDRRSRAWLRQRAPRLRELNAVGLAVNVESAEALAALRDLAPGLALSPASGDDLAVRLGLRHYPALITAAGIEQ